MWFDISLEYMHSEAINEIFAFYNMNDLVYMFGVYSCVSWSL